MTIFICTAIYLLFLALAWAFVVGARVATGEDDEQDH